MLNCIFCPCSEVWYGQKLMGARQRLRSRWRCSDDEGASWQVTSGVDALITSGVYQNATKAGASFHFRSGPSQVIREKDLSDTCNNYMFSKSNVVLLFLTLFERGLVVVDLDVGTRDDRLDDGLAVWALSLPVDVERLWGLVKGEAVGDQGLEVDLALGGKRDAELIIAGLLRGMSNNDDELGR